jgi:hypothetical protein
MRKPFCQIVARLAAIPCSQERQAHGSIRTT